MSTIFAFAADRGFVLPLVVGLSSLAKSCGRPIQVAVFTTDIPWSVRQRISDCFGARAQQGSGLAWYDLDASRLKDCPARLFHLNCLTYARILVPELLRSAEEEIVYLDCDILVTGDIAGWVGAEPLEMPLGAVQDFIAPQWGSPLGLPYLLPELPGFASHRIFNGGVLRIKAAFWRQERIEKECLEFIAKHSQRITSDQDALNFVFRDQWQPLHPKWNFMTSRDDEQLAPERFKEIQEVSLDNAIIHYCTSQKPWNSGLRPRRDFTLWIKALRTSGWFNAWEFQRWRANHYLHLLWLSARKRI
jgi:lipopolysaccharide biosynthesis glycosyltransferase